MQGQDWVDSADGLSRAGVRVYKFEEEERLICSKKETLDIRLAEVKRSRNYSSESLQFWGLRRP